MFIDEIQICEKRATLIVNLWRHYHGPCRPHFDIWHLAFWNFDSWHSFFWNLDIWHWLWNSDIDIRNFLNVDIDIEMLTLAFLKVLHFTLEILTFLQLTLDPSISVTYYLDIIPEYINKENLVTVLHWKNVMWMVVFDRGHNRRDVSSPSGSHQVAWITHKEGKGKGGEKQATRASNWWRLTCLCTPIPKRQKMDCQAKQTKVCQIQIQMHLLAH